ncbi:MAG: MmgE/PrpD family protein [Chloroflexi bacterium]|nr:MmgE/PrpD family protein [Chloroflexota bacterium]
MSTKELAQFATNLRFEDLPTNVVEQAKNSIRDHLGNALFVGQQTPWGKSIAEFALKESQGNRTATVVGYRRGATEELAALANGTLGLGFEFEDVHLGGASHPAATIVPAALATAERETGQRKKPVSGKDAITAIVAAHEVAARIGTASHKETTEGDEMTWRGLHYQQVFLVFGAAVASGKLLGLDAERMAMALGIAGEQAAGTEQSHTEGAWSRRLHGGLAAANGIRAARLASWGFIGPTQILEGERNFYRAFAIQFHPEELTRGLGTEWDILDVWYKAYPCHGIAHPVIEAVLQLRQEYGLKPDQVELLTAYVSKSKAAHQRTDFPTIAAAQQAPRYLVAAAMVKGQVTVAEFTEEALRDPKVLSFAKDRVAIVQDPDINRRRSIIRPRTQLGRVVIKLKDGRELGREVIHPLGTVGNPMKREQMEAKFNQLAVGNMAPAQIENLRKKLGQLEDAKSVFELTDILAKR